MEEQKMMDAMSGVEWPATRQEIWDKAMENDADEETMDMLKKMPDMTYENMDVVKEKMSPEGEEEDMKEDDKEHEC